MDTNVLSEILRPLPHEGVMGWLRGQPDESLFLTTVSEGELRLGVARLPRGRRRTALSEVVDRLLDDRFTGRILPYDSPAARAFADIGARRRAMGRPISAPDCQIAAIALSRGAALATRNVRDFEACGIEIVDPWDAAGRP